MIKSTATTDEIVSDIGRSLQRYRVQQNRATEAIATDADIRVRGRSDGGSW